MNDENVKLLSGAYWRQNCDEESLVLKFRSLVPAFVEREPLDDWELYYLMHSYGLPTRLLDLTKSALDALYFALESEASGKIPCVWMIDPVCQNEATLGPSYKVLLVPMADSKEFKYWLPEYCGRGKSPHKFEHSEHYTDNTKP